MTQLDRDHMMLRMKQLLLGIALGTAAVSATAGMSGAGDSASPIARTSCPGIGANKSSALEAAPGTGAAHKTDAVSRGHARCRGFTEYLGFHAEAKQQSADSLLMPWSQLRTPAD